jgi:hypothetical protein
MTRLCDIVTIARRDAAIRLDDGLSAHAEILVDAFTPTRSSISILTHIQKAVLANAPQQSRSIIWHGIYGSGKSHLGVLVGELLRSGIGTNAMLGFLDRLRNLGESRLSEEIKTTFHALGDQDARPYLVVTLYGSPAPTLQNALLEGLYRTLRDTNGLDPQVIIPKTEFAAALERLAVILAHEPAFADRPLSDWQIRSAAYNLEELRLQLSGFVPEALEAFKEWHPKVSAGSAFDPQALGGMGVADAFREAGTALARDHGYNGIAVIWDEFGYALESLFNQRQRNPVEEIFNLQKFAETTGAPPRGHTFFIALTHRSLREYGASSKVSEDVKNRLETIEGRFSGFPVALKSSEIEGYHLLSALVARTSSGGNLLDLAQPRADALTRVCARMPLFSGLASELGQIVTGCYPLHPVTAAGLFAIAAHGVYAQANRTVFTFFENLEAATTGEALERPVATDALYGDELLRLPELLTVYRKEVFDEYPGLADAFKHANATVMQGFPEAHKAKQDILAVLLLSRVLGEQFQPTDAFLAATLYDAENKPLALTQELEALQRAGLIWRRDTDVPVWELEAESGTQIEPLIEEGLTQLPKRTISDYFQHHPNILQDLLPQCGIHDLDPSQAGIVRSYEVRVLGDIGKIPTRSGSERGGSPTIFQGYRSAHGAAADPPDERLSALVILLTVEDDRHADQAIQFCEFAQSPRHMTYVWIPRRGLRELVEPLRRLIVIEGLLKQQATGEGLGRRLRNEFDKTRKQLRAEISERLGRVGLERGDVTIIHLGDPDEQIVVKSWHGFIEYLARQVQALYPKEVKVRSMNANRLYNNDQRKINGIENLLNNILHFDDLPPNLRNDLFGERDTSEIAALIDGTLGIYSNGLLIERADGWGLKTPDEATGTAGDLLRVIRSTVLDNRRKICDLTELRATLFAPPFGLPATVMPVFTAVAIRKDVGRLKWVNQNQAGSFHTSLWGAFTGGSTVKLRFDTFKPKQLQILNAIYQVWRMPPPVSIDQEDQAREIVTKLRAYHGSLPEAVKGSAKLSEEARQLFQILKKPGLDAQDVADSLMDITRAASDADQIRATLQSIFDLVESIKDERAAAVQQVITPVLQEPDRKERVTSVLKTQGKSDLAKALERIDQGQSEGLSDVARIMVGRGLDQCSDIEIGRLSGDLQRLLEQAMSPDPRLTADLPAGANTQLAGHNAAPTPLVDPAPLLPGQSNQDRFKQDLKALIDRYRTVLEAEHLATLLTNEIQRLANPAAANTTES